MPTLNAVIFVQSERGAITLARILLGAAESADVIWDLWDNTYRSREDATRTLYYPIYIWIYYIVNTYYYKFFFFFNN